MTDTRFETTYEGSKHTKHQNTDMSKPKRTIVLDVETTGFPRMLGWGKFYPPERLEAYDASRIVSIAWSILDEELNTVMCKYFVVRPEDFKIDDKSRATEIHGITAAVAEGGRPMKEILELLFDDARNCSRFVAHNVNFDLNIVKSEAVRSEMPLLSAILNKIDAFCTMENGKGITKIPHRGGWKWPKLVELYSHMFGVAFCAHNALEDVLAASKCYKKMVHVK